MRRWASGFSTSMRSLLGALGFMLRKRSRLIWWIGALQLQHFHWRMKRILSKKSLTLHKDHNFKEHLKSIENFQPTKENILEKLLHHSGAPKKAPPEAEEKKYNPKFEKRDYETIAQQNICLKQELQQEREAAGGLKFRLGEAERKAKLLEGMQERLARGIEEQEEGKKQPVYTEILKKKIQELNENNIALEEKIKELKHLPHVSVFDEGSVEKEYLAREAIRLRAIVSSLQAGSPEDDFENKFLRLMKEENEKLKATVRQYENDKNLLKSRQVIQKRQILQFRKECEQLRQKLAYKEAEIEKLNNENKNLLFKRVNQLKMEEQRKESEEIVRLRGVVEQGREELRRVEGEKELLHAEYQKLKKNEQLIESMQNNEDKEKYELRMANNRWKRMVEDLRDELDNERENLRVLETQHRKKRREKARVVAHPQIELHRPVKIEEIELALIVLHHQLNNGQIGQLAELFPESQLRCGRLIELFVDEPLGLERQEATKLARYIVEDNNLSKVVYDDKATATREYCVVTLNAALNRLRECCSKENEEIWRFILAKSKKLLPELEKMRGEVISKETLLGLLSRLMSENFGDYVTYAVMESFDLDNSEAEVMVRVDLLLDFLHSL